MTVLETRVDPDSADYEANRARMEELVAELRGRTTQVAGGGGAEAVARHRSRGKLLARERVDRLLDPGSSFLELGSLAASGPVRGWRAVRGDRHRDRRRVGA